MNKSYKIWHPQEIEYLSKNYLSKNIDELSKYLDRSPQSICRKAFKLGLAKRTPKLDLEIVKNEFSRIGYLLLQNYYVNSKTPILFECPKGHRSKLSWNKFKAGRRCSYCYIETGVMIRRIKKLVKSQGFSITNERHSSPYIVSVCCPNKHKLDVSFFYLSRGINCWKCESSKLETEGTLTVSIVAIPKWDLKAEINSLSIYY